MQPQNYVNTSVAQREKTEKVEAFRGEIVDRNGTILASSTDTDSVLADLYQVKENTQAQIIKTLAPILNTSEIDLQRKFNSGSKSPVLAKQVDVQVSQNIRTSMEAAKLSGIKVIRETQRRYPNGTLASHLLGFVNGAAQGVGGLEMQLDKRLAGQDGENKYEKDAVGKPFARTEKDALSGARVITTIDAGLQSQVEAAMAQALAETQADSISAIVIDPKTGEVLAMANAPTFDPAARWSGSDQEALRRNRAITDIYEPGSVFKIVGYSAAIEEGLVSPDEKIHCNGSVTIGNRIIKDEHCHGELTLSQALAKSSNTGAIYVARKVGNEKMAEYISRFGFGHRTGIDLPAEAVGLIRPLEKWQATSIGSIAIGHEVGITALQAVSAMAAIGNGGEWVRPHVIKRIVTGDAGQRTLWESERESRRVISQQTATTITSMLEGVVESGTARHAVQLGGYTAAGKTGTAQKIIGGRYSDTAYVASFAGFVPAINPRFAIIVTIDNPKGAHQGGQVAAPIFSRIAQSALVGYGVLPDNEKVKQGIAELETRYKEKSSDWNWQPEATPKATTKASVATVVPTLKPTVRPTVKPSATPAMVKVSATPKPILKLPTPPPAKPAVTVKNVPDKPKPQPVVNSGPNVTGRGLREVASLCSQAGLKLRAIGSGVAHSQRRQGDTLVVEFK
jgi:cell division protein FtsI/penicillin-binding protein 2